MYTDGWRLHSKVIKLIKVVLLVLLMILKGDNNFETPCTHLSVPFGAVLMKFTMVNTYSG